MSNEEARLKNSIKCKTWREKNKQKIRENDCSNPARKYNHTRNSARNRNLEFNLTLEQYTELIKDRTCHYCDEKFLNEIGSNLNRIDNTKGYVIGNLRPCCKYCNEFMSDYTKEEMQTRLLKIVQRMD